MKKVQIVILVSLASLISCSVDKSDIRYGEEICSNCHMTIIDGRYGAELVTKKGKIFKFDAIECLINFKLNNPEIAESLDSEWTNVQDDETTLFDASTCVYLRSPELPSPMGMYLNGFKNKESAEKVRNAQGGTIYSWDELNQNFKTLPVINQQSQESTPANK